MTSPLPAGSRLLAERVVEVFAAVPVVKRKTANQIRNNTSTLGNDNHLAWTGEANGVYTLDLYLFYGSGTTPDFKFDWSAPSGTTWNWGATYYNLSGTLTSSGAFTEATTGAVGGLGVGTVIMVEAHYVFTLDSTPGTLQLQWAQNTANVSDTTVYAGSYGVLTQVQT